MSRGRARSGRGAQRPASAFERTLTMTKEQKVIRSKLGIHGSRVAARQVARSQDMGDSATVGRFKEPTRPAASWPFRS